MTSEHADGPTYQIEDHPTTASNHIVDLVPRVQRHRVPPETIDLVHLGDLSATLARLRRRQPWDPAQEHSTKFSEYGQVSRTPRFGNSWEFAGWGRTVRVRLESENSSTIEEIGSLHNKGSLGEWSSTAIAANDLIGSVLYTTGLAITAAGQYAPISLFLACLVMYMYRFIFAEVGSCVPVNGGCYSTMLAASSKLVAAIAACCSILDYLATAVVSAASASTYFRDEFGIINVIGATVGILLFFAALNLLGIRESSHVSFAIFAVHATTLVCLTGAGVVQWVRNGVGTLRANWNEPSPNDNAPLDIFFGFCVGMLGFTGFEDSVNYIEEQKPGVFPKTMRNLAIMAIINPILTLVCLAIVPRNLVALYPNSAVSLIADAAGGRALRTIVSVDAVMVLCGGVLTAFVGVVGLLEHMSADRLLPRFLLVRNQLRGSHHWITLLFLSLCLVLVGVTRGDTTLASLLMATSFIAVLLAIAIANLLLKYKRGRLKREVRASSGTVVAGILAVVIAIVGNAIYDPPMIGTFAVFFAILFLAMWGVLSQVRVLKVLIFVADAYPKLRKLVDRLISAVIAIRSHPV
ncbi:hypothetical protein SpCBS45565_g05712 [Spizellomyces sp. 'palustris']|nr:hypothetical protein SpCBS45565_g05712 [Spizellomyces sp. 'palustris']